MEKRNTYLILILVSFLSSTFSASVFSQPVSIGISWNNVPSGPSQISAQLNTFKKIGAQYLELKHPVSPVLLDSISNYSFQVFIRFEREFLTSSLIKSNRDELIKDYSSLVLQYSDYDQIVAYGLYSFSQSFDADFTNQFESLSSELKKITNREFYEISSGPYNALDFSIYEITSNSLPTNIPAFLFSKESENDAQLLNDLFEKKPRLLFFDSVWFSKAVHLNPYLLQALQNYKNGEEFILPLQKQEPLTPAFNWPVLVFVLIWISLGIHILISQTYKPLIFRFFSGHRFFVDDIMRYRERTFLSGTFLLFQHAVFTGLVIYILSSLLISEKGLEALFYFLPQAAIFGQNYFSIFIIGMIISILVQFIGLMWLYLPSKSMTHFSQALNLYTWIFHLDFILVSIMLILLLSDGSGLVIMILGVLFVLNWLLGFLFTAVDSSKYLVQKRPSYILYTFGLHTVINITLLILVLSNDYLIDLLELLFVL